MNKTWDGLCNTAIRKSPNLMIPWYLMASYAYYVEDESILTDSLYDDLCKKILASFDTLQHRHKHLIDRESLEAGTGFALIYPTIVSGAVRDVRSQKGSYAKVK